MAQREPTASEALYPHLTKQSDEVERPVHRNALAEALYPRPKPAPTNYYRESLLRGLRELNAKVKERRR
jgi:hypothetical protein